MGQKQTTRRKKKQLEKRAEKNRLALLELRKRMDALAAEMGVKLIREELEDEVEEELASVR